MIDNAAGVLGGLGPAATVAFMNRVIELTVAERDQDHVNMVVLNHATVPDRTAYFVGEGEDPLPQLLDDARTLEQFGVRFLVMPCNTASYYHPELSAAVHIPFIDIITVALQAALDRVPGLRRVGLLATDGTVRIGAYHRVAEQLGLEVLTPGPAVQAGVMQMIYAGIKAGHPVPIETIEAAIQAIRDQGAQAVILGCTELSTAALECGLQADDVIDSIDSLARATVRAAGKQLRED